MSGNCFKCGKEIATDAAFKVARSDSCPSCGSDSRCCRNCRFYDTSAYNHCAEPQAERVVDKERSNFCDYFHVREGGSADGGPSKADHRKRLDDLFK